MLVTTLRGKITNNYRYCQLSPSTLTTNLCKYNHLWFVQLILEKYAYCLFIWKYFELQIVVFLTVSIHSSFFFSVWPRFTLCLLLYTAPSDLRPQTTYLSLRSGPWLSFLSNIWVIVPQTEKNQAIWPVSKSRLIATPLQGQWDMRWGNHQRVPGSACRSQSHTAGHVSS